MHAYRRVHGIFRMQRTRGTHTTRHTYIRVQPGPTRGYAHEYRVRHAPALTAATNGLWAGGAGRQWGRPGLQSGREYGHCREWI